MDRAGGRRDHQSSALMQLAIFGAGRYRDPEGCTGKAFIIFVAGSLIVGMIVHTYRATHPGLAPVTTPAAQATPSAWEDGHTAGYAVGASITRTHRQAPTEAELEAMVSRNLPYHSAYAGEREQWERGFRSGYEDAYNHFARPAFPP